MVRSKFSAAVYLLLVFSSGILVGAVGNRLYVTNTVAANNAPAPRTMAQYRARFLAEMKQKVGANDQQIAQITAILDDAKRKFDEVHAQAKPLRDKIDHDRIEGIRAVLDDKQRAAYDQWRADRSRAEAEKQKQKKNN